MIYRIWNAVVFGGIWRNGRAAHKLSFNPEPAATALATRNAPSPLAPMRRRRWLRVKQSSG